MSMKSAVWFASWLAVTTGLVAYLTSMWLGAAPLSLMPGPSTGGHYQIEDRCELCHTPGNGVKQDACVGCHAAELDAVDDSHPESKFLDPRNADRLQRLNARSCLTCHVEHRPTWVSEPAVTIPRDYCVRCHADIGDERPSHAGLGFSTCASAGCHNYHDNRALTEDFLAAHLDEPPLLASPRVPERAVWTDATPLSRDDVDAPPAARDEAAVVEWLASSHAAAGVRCTDCHGAGDAWTERPGRDACRDCHDAEVAGFEASRHGMRVAAALPPLELADARRPMHARAAGTAPTCHGCHAAHRYDTRAAAQSACRSCHDDDHSAACDSGPHVAAWWAELAGGAAPGTGASCATCHLPRIELNGRVRVVHNQNDVLRPNEKMLRPVCGQCHGVGFSLDALADRPLIDRCFDQPPATRVGSLDMVRAKRGAAASNQEDSP